MAKPIITLNGLKIVIMLGMLVIILTGIRFAADIICSRSSLRCSSPW
ncbi:Transport of quorum-sensing signal protein [Raoultella planticola]|uniref:Transport of quorum-sensing signal protein n=1 Tax=Raoultella planticola TaxID=575 RepID=A0A485CUD8_RAOPL|nr:Transport of quorum-sensing signal protein [Raoultella planticola]